MTVFGKSLVFITVFLSLVGLGFATWAFIDRHDWGKKLQTLKQEITQRNAAAQREGAALWVLLDERDRGNRAMPWDYSADAADPKQVKLNPPKPITVNQAHKEIAKLEADLVDLYKTTIKLRTQVTNLLNELKAERDKVQAALEEQRLRELINPEKAGAFKGVRPLIEEMRQATRTVESRQEAIKPDLFNELVKIALLEQRNEELRRRLQELEAKKKEPVTTVAPREE
jgi:regulator of replication initiation timing